MYRLLLLSGACLALVGVLRAQEPPATQPAAGAAESEAAQAGRSEAAEEASAATTAEKPAGDEAAAPPGPSNERAPSTPSPARFEPTEKVRADFDVSFPVDI
jgi:cytoskeletal protein RodZ